MKRKTKRIWYVNLFVRDFYSGRGAKKIVHEFVDSDSNEIWPNLYAMKNSDIIQIR